MKLRKPEVDKSYNAWVSVKIDIGCEAASKQRCKESYVIVQDLKFIRTQYLHTIETVCRWFLHCHQPTFLMICCPQIGILRDLYTLRCVAHRKIVTSTSLLSLKFYGLIWNKLLWKNKEHISIYNTFCFWILLCGWP